MGEYAEMVLDGTCCSSCGEFIGSGDGYAIECASCRRENPANAPKRKMGKATRKLLLDMHRHGKQMKLVFITTPIYALINRGYAESCNRYEFYQLTPAGKAKAIEIDAARASRNEGEE